MSQQISQQISQQQISRDIDGHAVVVDTIDADLLDLYPWRVGTPGNIKDLRVYATSREKSTGKALTPYLHILVAERIAQETGQPFRYVGFKNGNHCDIRRDNLSLSLRHQSRIECPWSAEELTDLYTRQFVSIEQLRVLAARKIAVDAGSTDTGERKIGDLVVRRWLEEAGCTIRTQAEHARLVAERNAAAKEAQRIASGKPRRRRADREFLLSSAATGDPNIAILIVDGNRVTVDRQDADLLAGVAWRARQKPNGDGMRIEAVVRHPETGRQGTRFLHRLIADRIAAATGAPFLYAWMRDGDPFNLRRANLVLSLLQPRALACPWSQKELRRLYLTEKLSVSELQRRAARPDQEKITEAAVLRWLADAGIRRRSLSEEGRLRGERDPEWLRSLAEQGRLRAQRDPEGLRRMQAAARAVVQRRIAEGTWTTDPTGSRFQTPAARAKQAAAMQTQSYREKHRARWNDPEQRARMLQARERYWSTLTPEQLAARVTPMFTPAAIARRRLTWSRRRELRERLEAQRRRRSEALRRAAIRRWQQLKADPERYASVLQRIRSGIHEGRNRSKLAAFQRDIAAMENILNKTAE